MKITAQKIRQGRYYIDTVEITEGAYEVPDSICQTDAYKSLVEAGKITEHKPSKPATKKEKSAAE